MSTACPISCTYNHFRYRYYSMMTSNPASPLFDFPCLSFLLTFDVVTTYSSFARRMTCLNNVYCLFMLRVTSLSIVFECYSLSGHLHYAFYVIFLHKPQLLNAFPLFYYSPMTHVRTTELTQPHNSIAMHHLSLTDILRRMSINCGMLLLVGFSTCVFLHTFSIR